MTSVSLMHKAGHSKLVLWDNLEGQSGEGGGRGLRMGRTHVYLWPVYVDVWQKPSQYYKVIILQLKLIKKKTSSLECTIGAN